MGRKESNQTNKYLGVELQWSLSWNLHINQTVKKANRRLLTLLQAEQIQIRQLL